jgi:hypothetical protein
MTTVDEIKVAVEHLSMDELTHFRIWFAEFEAKLWDDKIERDIISGKLSQFAEEALTEFQVGKCTEL